MKGEAYAAGTVINALSTRKGSAFALNLKTRVEVTPDEKTYVVKDGEARSSMVVEEVLSKLEINANVRVKVESNIPTGCGLGSSSAFVNALIVALCRMEEIELKAEEILKLNAEVSKKCGISYTGALDDAAASLLGGFVVTDNEKLKILRRDERDFLRENKAAVLIPKWGRKDVSIEKMRKGNVEIIESAFELAMEGLYCEAMRLNSDYCCAILGYDEKPVRIAEKADLCAGLSGNGPAYVAYGSMENLSRIIGEWTRFGKVILTTIPEKPCY